MALLACLAEEWQPEGLADWHREGRAGVLMFMLIVTYGGAGNGCRRRCC